MHITILNIATNWQAYTKHSNKKMYNIFEIIFPQYILEY